MAEQVIADSEGFAPVDLNNDLRRVRSISGSGLYASDDVAFRDAIFGRDMAEAALDLLGIPILDGGREIATDSNGMKALPREVK